MANISNGAYAGVAEMLQDHFDSKESSGVRLPASVIDDPRWDIVRERVADPDLNDNTKYDILIRCVVEEGVSTRDGGVHQVTGFSDPQIKDSDFA